MWTGRGHAVERTCRRRGTSRGRGDDVEMTSRAGGFLDFLLRFSSRETTSDVERTSAGRETSSDVEWTTNIQDHHQRGRVDPWMEVEQEEEGGGFESEEVEDNVSEKMYIDSPDYSVLDLPEGLEVRTATSIYRVIKFINEGVFGKVALWEDLHTQETVAVKILKRKHSKQVEKEVKILHSICNLGPDTVNMVTLRGWLKLRGHDALVFETLDIDLDQLISRRDSRPLPLSEIRVIAKQLLVALDALKGLGVLHTDIKPDNVMLVSAEEQPLKVKLIDFGNALYASDVTFGQIIQPLWYRAPEVFLGLPFTEAVDMWGLGCLLAFLYRAVHLFPAYSKYEMMMWMVEALGLPKAHQLQSGLYTDWYFTSEDPDRTRWRLLTPGEFAARNEELEPELQNCFMLPSLDSLAYKERPRQAERLEDRQVFIDLLKGMLNMDAAQRLTPQQALQHPFVTGSQIGPQYRVSEKMDLEVTDISDDIESQSSINGLREVPISLAKEEDAEEDQGTLDNVSSLKMDSLPSETPSSRTAADSLNGSSQTFESEDVEDPAKRSPTVSEAADLLGSCSSLDISNVSLSLTSSSDSDINLSQIMADATPPPADTQCTATTGRPRKSKLRRFFKRIRNFFCGCCRPQVEE